MDATIHVGRQLVWEASDTTPEEIDAQADRLREEGHVPIVHVTMTRSERRAINKAVRERDGQRAAVAHAARMAEAPCLAPPLGA